MLDLVPTIIEYLLADTSVTAVCSNFVADFEPDSSAALPRGVVTEINQKPLLDLGCNRERIDEAAVEIEILADTRTDLDTILNLVEASLLAMSATSLSGNREMFTGPVFEARKIFCTSDNWVGILTFTFYLSCSTSQEG